MRYFLVFISCFTANIVWAQDWYEIEVLIFEHQSNAFVNFNDPERWPANIDLAWPSPLIKLDTQESAESESDLAPYAELSADAQRLDNANYAMRVRDGYRLLWHRVWKAPLLPEEDSPWILIQAGEQIGEHYQLEGAIRVHLARFLHIHSDLWLTELLPSNSQEQTEFHWSQLPRPPVTGWPCIFIQESWPDSLREFPADFFETSAPDNWYYPFGCAINSRSDFAENNAVLSDLPLALPAELSALDANELDNNNDDRLLSPDTEADEHNARALATLGGGWGQNNSESDGQNSLSGSADPNAIQGNIGLEPGFPVKEIIHIQSQRRMRSEELHYIDHPKVGILAIIHPVETPAAAEETPVEYISAPLPTTRVNESSDDITE